MTQATDGIAKNPVIAFFRVSLRRDDEKVSDHAPIEPQFHGTGVIARPGFKVLPRFALSFSLSLSLSSDFVRLPTGKKLEIFSPRLVAHRRARYFYHRGAFSSSSSKTFAAHRVNQT